METFFLLMKKTRAKKFKVRMFYHLQNLFWGVFAQGLCLGVFCPVIFGKLDELREKYKKKDKLLICRMNSRSHLNQPTFVFKISDVACSLGRNMDRDGDHFMSQSYASFDGNEKRVGNMTIYTLSVYHFLLRRQVVLATMICEAENQGNAGMFFKTWNDALSENLDENNRVQV